MFADGRDCLTHLKDEEFGGKEVINFAMPARRQRA